MTLMTMTLYIAIAAALLTAAISYFKHRENDLFISYVQSFVGVLFLFSGFVKIVDPLGTTYKMEEYFQEFHTTFSESGLSFIAWVFPILEHYALAFSLFIILFELILGIVLLLGYQRKAAAWALLFISLLFTALTGFTYLTGYVPEGVSFFDVSHWGPHNPNNMKVTDCGCFGDFIKIDAFTTFLKSAFLLLPSILLILQWKKMYQLFSPGLRTALTGAALVGFFVYGLSNFMWNLPDIDFRPFAAGTELRSKRQAELDAMSNVKILSWKLQNKTNNQILTLSNDEYMKSYTQYPKENWKVLDQIQSEPEVPKTKASDFEVTDSEGNDRSDDILNDSGYSLWIVSYKLFGDVREVEKTYQDTLYRTDTIQLAKDSLVFRKIATDVVTKKRMVNQYVWRPDFVRLFTDKVNPLVESAMKKGVRAYAIIGGAANDQLESFGQAIGATYPLYQADDILLKTIVRSNPGVLLMKDGRILDKWHVRQLPNFEELKKKYF